jgi:hypothetical protein
MPASAAFLSKIKIAVAAGVVLMVGGGRGVVCCHQPPD